VPGAVGVARAELERLPRPRVPRAIGELLPYPLGVVRMDQIESVSADQVLGLVAEHALYGGAGIKPGAVRREDGDHIRRVHNQRPEALLAFLEALLRPLPLPPGLRFFEPPTYGGGQAREVVLHDVVVR